MKTKLLTIFFLIIIVSLSSGFIIRDNEENLNPGFNMYQKDECFAQFLLDLQRMEALIFIPKDNVDLVKSYNLFPVKKKKAKRTNIRFIKALKKFKMLTPEKNPANECSESVVTIYNDLDMKVFVRKNANTNFGSDVAVTPVPLPIPKPELNKNQSELEGITERNNVAVTPVPLPMPKPELNQNQSELEGKTKRNDVAVTPVPLPMPQPEMYINVDEDYRYQSEIPFKEKDSEWKLYVPVKLKL